MRLARPLPLLRCAPGDDGRRIKEIAALLPFHHAPQQFERFYVDCSSNIHELKHVYPVLLGLQFPDEAARPLQLRGQCPLAKASCLACLDDHIDQPAVSCASKMLHSCPRLGGSGIQVDPACTRLRCRLRMAVMHRKRVQKADPGRAATRPESYHATPG